jgi:hypothetical protein
MPGRPPVLTWAKANEKELALVVLSLLAGVSFGRVIGRHEK